MNYSSRKTPITFNLSSANCWNLPPRKIKTSITSAITLNSSKSSTNDCPVNDSKSLSCLRISGARMWWARKEKLWITVNLTLSRVCFASISTTVKTLAKSQKCWQEENQKSWWKTSTISLQKETWNKSTSTLTSSKSWLKVQEYVVLPSPVLKIIERDCLLLKVIFLSFARAWPKCWRSFVRRRRWVSRSWSWVKTITKTKTWGSFCRR